MQVKKVITSTTKNNSITFKTYTGNFDIAELHKKAAIAKARGGAVKIFIPVTHDPEETMFTQVLTSTLGPVIFNLTAD